MGVVRTDGVETAIARWTDRLIKERIKKETGEGKDSGTLAMHALYVAFKAINRAKELMVKAGYMWPGDVEKIEDEEPEEVVEEEKEEEEEHGEDNKEESHKGEDQHEGVEQEEEEEQVEEAKEIDVEGQQEGQQEDEGEQEEEREQEEKEDEEEQAKDEGGYDMLMVGLIEGPVGKIERTTPSPIVIVPSHSAPIQPKDGNGFQLYARHLRRSCRLERQCISPFQVESLYKNATLSPDEKALLYYYSIILTDPSRVSLDE